MDFKASAAKIVEAVGGKENIASLTHCVTRLRIVPKDESKVDKEALSGVEGVMKVVVAGGQYQAVIGPQVGDMFAAVQDVTGPLEQVKDAVPAVKEKRTVGSVLKGILDTIVACFVPAIPVIAGAGMIKVLAVMLNYFGLLSTESTTYMILNNVIGDGVFYFLPFFVAYNAAKKMEVNPLLAMALAALIQTPKFLDLANLGRAVTLFRLPVDVIDYSAQAIPMILGVLLLKYVDKFAEKVSPKVVAIFLRTMIDLLVVGSVMLLVLGPVSMFLTNAVLDLCKGMMNMGWLAVGVNALIFPLLVLTGTHNATIPLIVQLFASQGFDPIFLVSGLAVNIAQAGAACAAALKTKNRNLRATGLSATLSALLGITEPALYGVNLRMKKPFITMMIGAFIGGCYCGLIHLAAPAFATPSLLTFAIFVPQGSSILLGLSGVLVSFAAAFILTWIVGFKDLPADETENKE